MSRDQNKDRGERLPSYQPSRAAKLCSAVDAPPPLPPAGDPGHAAFAAPGEDELHMLAAWENLTSLEPDYSDEIAAEASVTIIEAVGEDLLAGAFAPDAGPHPRRAAVEDSEPGLLLNGYETFLGPGDEATVEIVEVAHTFDTPEPPPPSHAARPASLAERIAAAAGGSGRFFKALSGG